MADDWAEQFKQLLDTPLGKELERTLREDVHDNLVAEAENASNPEIAFGLLKEAGGVIKTLKHLKSLAGLASLNEGGKN